MDSVTMRLQGAHLRQALAALFLLSHAAVAVADVRCLQAALAEQAPGRHFLSVSPSPLGLLIETATGIWGEPLGASQVAIRDCDTGRSVPLQLEGVTEVSDPWFDVASQRLYFVARNPGEEELNGDRDIWVTGRADGQWLRPWRLPAPINSSQDEHSPIVRDGRVYFASSRDPTNGQLFVADNVGDGWSVEPLPDVINSPGGEWNLWVSPAQDRIIFETSGRDSSRAAAGDLYGASLDDQGRWRAAIRLDPLNQPGSDLNPRQVGQYMVHARVGRDGLARPVVTPMSEIIDVERQAFSSPLMVVNRSSHSFSMVDLLRGDAGPERSVGKGPHLLADSPSGGRVAVPSYGIYPRPHSGPVRASPGWVTEDGGAIHVVDAGGRITVFDSSCLRPHGVTWVTETDLWASCEDRQALVAIDTTAPSERPRLLATGHVGAHVLWYDRQRHQVVASHTGSGGLWLQPVGGGEGRFIPVGDGAEAMMPLDDGRLAVSLGPSNAIAVVDLDDGSVAAKHRPGCTFPIDFAIDTQRRLWVACLFNREVIALDPDNGAVLERVALGTGPLNIVAHPTQPILYASLPRENRVIEIALDSGRVARSFDVGIEPDGLLLR